MKMLPCRMGQLNREGNLIYELSLTYLDRMGHAAVQVSASARARVHCDTRKRLDIAEDKQNAFGHFDDVIHTAQPGCGRIRGCRRGQHGAIRSCTIVESAIGVGRLGGVS